MSLRRDTLLLLASGVLLGCERAPEPLAPPGGSWTARPSVRPTLVVPATVLDSRQKLDFWTGFGFFRDPWVTAPASTTARDGLGPLFNAQSCVACHAGGGRGTSLLVEPVTVSTIAKLGVRCGEAIVPHPQFGEQLQTRAVYAQKPDAGARAVGAYFPGEATLKVEMTTHRVEFADGLSIDLRRPLFSVASAHVDQWTGTQCGGGGGGGGTGTQANGGGGSEGGDEGTGTLLSGRIAPSLVGLGLLESIPSERLEALADPVDANNDGISGRVHLRGGERAGRFGWKAVHATVAEQTAAAFAQDLGISNPLQPGQNCTEQQPECLAQPTGNDAVHDVEITPDLFDQVVWFASHLAPPPAGESTLAVDRGRRLFSKTGCGNCHTPSHTVQMAQPDGTVRSEEIWPYTDLLLHDMGAELADPLPEGDATGSEWRTPPLWGLGSSLAINENTGLLHDGRASSVAEAIAWHGGEAATSRGRFLQLDAEERAALRAFVLAL